MIHIDDTNTGTYAAPTRHAFAEANVRTFLVRVGDGPITAHHIAADGTLSRNALDHVARIPGDPNLLDAARTPAEIAAKLDDAAALARVTGSRASTEIDDRTNVGGARVAYRWIRDDAAATELAHLDLEPAPAPAPVKRPSSRNAGLRTCRCDAFEGAHDYGLTSPLGGRACTAVDPFEAALARVEDTADRIIAARSTGSDPVRLDAAALAIADRLESNDRARASFREVADQLEDRPEAFALLDIDHILTVIQGQDSAYGYALCDVLGVPGGAIAPRDHRQLADYLRQLVAHTR